MPVKPAARLLDLLPAIYRSDDAGDDLPALLGVFEALLFDGDDDGEDDGGLHGIARRIDAMPHLFAPLGMDDPDGPERTPDRFVPWLATWLAFTPAPLFEPARLRRIVAGIVPLHGRRGTRAYLDTLLRLCFDEIAEVRIDERQRAGLRLGESRLGVDSLLAHDRPFRFSVEIALRPGTFATAAPRGSAAATRFERQVRATIDFAKPAHTAYELRLHRAPAGTPAAD